MQSAIGLKRLQGHPASRLIWQHRYHLCSRARSTTIRANNALVATTALRHDNQNTNIIIKINNNYGYTFGAFQSRTFTSSTPPTMEEYPAHEIYSMPALSPTMEMGTIAKWNIEVGQEFGPGDSLCTVETDKASVDFEAQDDGVLAKILLEGPNAVDIAVGTPICVVVEDTDAVAGFSGFELSEGRPAVEAPESAATTTATATPISTPAPTAASGHHLSDEYVLLPSARFLSESKGLDATRLIGSGKGGRVTKGDVLQAIASGTPMPALAAKAVNTPSPAPAPTAAASVLPPVGSTAPVAPLVDLPLPPVDSHGTYEDFANNNMRKVIARRLTESKRDVPHYYISVEVELDNIMKLRKQLVKDHDVKVSVNDIIIRCCSLALRDVPEVNGTYDAKSDTVKLQDSIDVSVAVATPSGLITPIVPNADEMGLSDITNKVRDLATRAREGKLQPEEYQGGTFCISNLGMFGIDEFSAVINPPQAAILAVGGGSRRVVPTPYIDGAEAQPKPSIKTIMTARLSADRRVVDEATAALFLSAFESYMAKPELLLL